MSNPLNADLLAAFADFLKSREAVSVDESGKPGLTTTLNEYRNYLIAQGKSEQTARDYYLRVGMLQREYGLDPLGLTAPKVIEWAALFARKCKPRTVSTVYSALRSWADYTGQSHAVGSLKAPRIDPTPQPLPPRADVEALRDALRPSKHARSSTATTLRRDGAVFDLLFECALRISEVVALDMSDLRYRDEYGGVGQWHPAVPLTHVWISESKRGKSRLVPLTPTVQRTLTNWASIHRPLQGPVTPESPLFLSGYRGSKERLSEARFRKRLRKLGQSLQIESVAGKTHTGRRMKITDLIANGAKPNAIVKITGHKSAKELEPYIVLTDELAEREWLEHSGKRTKKRKS